MGDSRGERGTAAGDDSLFDSRARRVERIFDAGLLLFHLRLGRSAHVDLCNAARQLSETLLELLAVVVGLGVLSVVGYVDGSDVGLIIDLIFG